MGEGRTGARLLLRWVRATWLGWLLGIPLIVALALVGEAVGIGGAQGLVGAGMGAGIGLAQGRVVRDLLGRWAPWFWSCVLGLSAPFVLADLARIAGLGLGYSLPVCVMLGGLAVGVWQAVILAGRMRHTWRWFAANAVGWSLVAATSAVGDVVSRPGVLRGIAGALGYLGIMASGGLVLGLVTGAALVWMLRHEPPA